MRNYRLTLCALVVAGSFTGCCSTNSGQPGFFARMKERICNPACACSTPTSYGGTPGMTTSLPIYSNGPMIGQPEGGIPRISSPGIQEDARPMPIKPDAKEMNRSPAKPISEVKISRE